MPKILLAQSAKAWSMDRGSVFSGSPSEWSVNEMSENGLSMACDLRLCSLFLLAEKKERNYKICLVFLWQTRVFAVVYV